VNAWRFIGGRLAVMVPTLFFVSVMVFGLQRLLPGDPITAMLAEDYDAEAAETLKRRYHLDKPIHEQYVLWAAGLFRGDFGVSIRNNLEVAELILARIPVTLELAILSLAFALLIGIPAGILSAVKKDTPTDVVANVVALSGISVPNFWLGIMMILLFAVHLQILPASGYVPFFEDPIANLKSMIMPAFVLGTGGAGLIMRHMRGAMLETLLQDYVRTARAKGCRERVVVLKHALRNALVPVITLGALEFGHLLSGAVLTEQIFTIPGFGKLIVDGVFSRDYTVVQSVVLVVALIYISLNLMADILYFVVNPRLRG
jgi:peptide/nickel transport system permease protein